MAEMEMKRAEEKAAARSKEYEEYMERRKKGEGKAEYPEEVKDTLRWGKDDDKGKKDGRPNKKDRGRAPNEKTHRLPEVSEVPAKRHNDEIVFERELKEEGKRNAAGRKYEPEAEEEEEEVENRNEVEEWLTNHGLPQYAKAFEEEGWDTMDSVYTMTEVGRRARATPHADMLDLGMKKGHPWAEAQPHAWDDYERRDGGSGLHTSVRTRYGPGGSSKLADAGGLGAFLMGGDEEEEDYAPAHRRLQARKEQIISELEELRREHIKRSR
ncbi:hypothetical protein GUITHDRAFT_141525 [Guillardia theta CCMP2712]|uniref:SAM domain-containing protein n=1 Tax=Guillardia theta (strain CCMP2712) TaxID=905079 RepID=L1J0J2_GUITC|nr:hypothetical protein GUITHDRAFT_141525 [Guillardia theta CCMP2712]EKX42053.1 hypothetical protein GUITHDRAFT_141525 [Guillardia theta CCMP2712]|eukprot:XP_005829033.1 hypothetical protein GUITHDRAFT_141525 [Guillardia theta CCMP2712]